MKRIRQTIICPLRKSVCGETNECNGSVGTQRKYADEPCPDCPINWELVPVIVYCNFGMRMQDNSREQCVECRDNRMKCEYDTDKPILSKTW